MHAIQRRQNRRVRDRPRGAQLVLDLSNSQTVVFPEQMHDRRLQLTKHMAGAAGAEFESSQSNSWPRVVHLVINRYGVSETLEYRIHQKLLSIVGSKMAAAFS